MHELLEVDGLGHAWSGGAAGGSHSDPRGPNASEAIWRFFANATTQEGLGSSHRTPCPRSGGGGEEEAPRQVGGRGDCERDARAATVAGRERVCGDRGREEGDARDDELRDQLPAAVRAALLAQRAERDQREPDREDRGAEQRARGDDPRRAQGTGAVTSRLRAP
jgi:hypothetical protein